MVQAHRELHLYEELADRITAMIDRGALKVGDRLPSVRKLSRQEGVSAATVVQAYAHLENRGTIEARPQSGHYVSSRSETAVEEPRLMKASNTVCRPSVQEQIMKVYRSGSDRSFLPLGAAYLSPELLPMEKLGRAMSLVARTAGEVGVSYDAPPGNILFRRAVARRSLGWGAPLKADDIVATVGAMEALHLCLRATTKPGDTIALESPGYYGLLTLVESLGLRVVEIPVHPRNGMDLDALEDALRRHKIKAVLCVPNFNNPTGSLMPDENKRALVEMLARREIPLIEDDVYGDLYFGAARPRPAKAFDRDGLVLLCGSFSKTIAPGYRAGWAAPGRFRDRVELLKFAHTLANATLPQLAIAEFLANGGYDHHLRTVRRKLADGVAQTRDAIAEKFPEGTRVSRPQGGFVLWVELPGNVDARELQRRLFQKGISIAPGPIFSAKQRFTSCVRINAGNTWSSAIVRGLETVGSIAAEMARGVS